MLANAKEMPTYMIFNLTQAVPSWPMEKIAEYQKGNTEGQKLRLFKIVSK